MNNMLKNVLIWFCVSLLLIAHTGYKYNTCGVSKEADIADVNAIIPETYHLFGGYICYLNNVGNIVMLDYYSNEIRVFDATFCNPSNIRFLLIREGMSPYQVVSLVGIPIALYRSGMSSVTTFLTNSGDNPSIQWEYVFENKGDRTEQNTVVRAGVSVPIGKIPNADQYITENNRMFPMLQLVPWLHNLLDGAIVWAAILYTEKLRMQKKKTAEAQ